MLEIAAVVALNVALVAPEATVTEAGTVSAEVLLESAMLAPPAGAAWFKVTVEALEVFAPKVVGLHASDEICAVATKLIFVVSEAPFRVAVSVAS